MMPKENKPHRATLRDLIDLDYPLRVRLSPVGGWVAFTIRSTNWKDDRYDLLCYITDVASGVTRQLTRQGSVNQLAWLDDHTLALLKSNGGKAQVWLYEGGTGEGWQVTDHKTGVEWFQPFAEGLVYQARQPEKDEKKSRADQFGKFNHFEQEDSASAVYYVSVPEMRSYQRQLRALTEDEGRKLITPVMELSRLFNEQTAIKEVIASPTGDTLYLNCWQREDLVYLRESRVFQIKLNAASALAKYLKLEKAKQAKAASAKKKTAPKKKDAKEDVSYLGKLSELKLPKGARVVAVSPDGAKLLINYKERDQKFYTREDIWIANAQAIAGARSPKASLQAMTNLTAPFDRDLMTVHWTKAGIFGDYVDGTRVRIAQVSVKGKVTPLELGVVAEGGFHVSDSGHVALAGANATSFAEVYLAEPAQKKRAQRIQKLTDFGAQIKGWELGTVETIRWQSRDSTEIEGVLRKPAGFNPKKKYPLVVVVHGGPSWYSADYLLSFEDMHYYPSLQFNLKEVLVLKPNYRGSLGRGQAFLELNVNNLGVGDLWDVESAVDHLVNLGWVDPQKVGCMGWSQGGYISAFVGLHSDKFKAVSVGAGISDWYTYHISNDIPDFTRDYLSGSPFRDRTLYEKTAPISNLANAKTPMLIQHGSDDQRVPLSNATELYRGLKEMKIPVELFIFPGMAHPITKPRENHAVMHQNLNWFSHHLLGEKLKLE
jgi:dipeptidyl aminopeptidase/acylaminoacyl peptidase